MKFVYVLVSSEKDYFWEECFISITSLLKYNPEANVIVFTDDVTESTLKGNRAVIKDIADVRTISFSNGISMKTRSRLLKIRIREYLNDDFLYIDSDTVVSDRLEFPENFDIDVGMVLDAHTSIAGNPRRKYLTYNAKKISFHEGYDNKHFNGGVFYSKNSELSRSFFRMWEELYVYGEKRGIYIDQTSLNEANFRLKGVIKELDGEWNTQLNTGLKSFTKAKIMHYTGYQPNSKQALYFNTIPFELCQDIIFTDVKMTGTITEEVEKILENPKSSFKQSYIVSRDCLSYDLLFSNHMRLMKFLYKRMSRVFRFVDKILGALFLIIYKRP